MTRRGLIGLVAGGALALLVGCGDSTSKYRQKMVVEVETPDGVKTGFAVVEVGYSPPPGGILKGIPGNGFSVRGEAVTVEIAPGKTLFALLSPPPERGTSADWYQSMLFIDAMQAGAKPEPPLKLPANNDGRGIDAHKVVGASHAKLTLPQEIYPLLATFADNRDPKSVKQVDPTDLVASFGPGYKLKSITIQITDDPITSGIERRLQEMGIQPDHGLDSRPGVSGSLTLAQKLGYDNFRQGIKR